MFDEEVVDFDAFVLEHEARLRAALISTLGTAVGPDAAADAFVYAWEHWDRVRRMDNPVGYLYKVGRDRGRRQLGRRKPVIPQVPYHRAPWIEPGLSAAMAELPSRQRSVVILLHGYEWTMSEVADALGITKATVQTHHDRAMRRLRKKLGVPG